MYLLEFQAESIGIFTNLKKVIETIEIRTFFPEINILYALDYEPTFDYTYTNKHIRIRKMKKNVMFEIN